MAGPSWYERAHAEMGVEETPGAASTPRIMEYFAAAHGSEWVKDDSTPWCGAFASFILREHGLPDEPLRARSWAEWGEPLADPIPGCVVVLKRPPDPAAGHVALFVQWTADKAGLLLLGGNQGDKVCITRFRTTDVIAYRWPKGVKVPTGAQMANGSRILKESKELIATGSATVVAGAGAKTFELPAPPAETMAQLTAWQTFGVQAADFLGFVTSHWMLVAGILTAVAGVRLYQRRAQDAREGRTWQF